MKYTKFLLLITLTFSAVVFSQNDTIAKKTSRFAEMNFPFLLDDLMLAGGLNFGGIYMSQYPLELTYRGGYHFGLGHYQSIGKKVFLNYAFMYSQKGFNHHVGEKIRFTLNTWEVLTFAAYELPVLRDYDFRFLLGAHYNYFANLGQDRPYPDSRIENEGFMYSNHNLRKHDFGLFFGLSLERDDYYFRLSSTVGHVNVVNNDQGMFQNLNITVGYFPFRHYRQKQRLKQN